MYKTNLIVYGILTAFSFLMIVWIVPTQTPEGIGYGLAPSVMPYILSTVMLICSAWLLVKTLLTRSRQQGPGAFQKDDLIQLVKYIPIFFVTLPLMSWIGFIPVGIIILFLLQYMMGQRSILKNAAISIVITLLAYAGILYGLKAPLP